MGIRGLLSYIKQKKLYTDTDIIDVASRGKIKIIVQTISFHQFIRRIIAEKIVNYYKNDFLLLSFSEYDFSSNVYFDFHKAFQEAGIELVWVIDGPKVNKFPDDSSSVTTQEIDSTSINKSEASDDSPKIRGLNPGNEELPRENQRSIANIDAGESKLQPNQELSEMKSEELSNTGYPQDHLINWQKIIDNRERKNKILFECCETLKPMPFEETNLFIAFDAVRQELRDAGAEVIQLTNGSFNDDIFRIYKERNAYAILTNDTDFIFFENCQVIFTQFIESKLERLLNLPLIISKNIQVRTVKTPKNLLCPIACSELVIRSLELDNLDQFALVGVLLTRRVEETFFKDLLSTLNFKSSGNMHSIAKFVKQHEITASNVKEKPEVKAYLEMNPEVAELLTKYLDYYTLNRDVREIEILNESDENRDDLTRFLEEGFTSGTINHNCIDIHNGKYLRYMCIEESSNETFTEDVLSDLRTKMYPYLLNKRLTSVTEWDPRNKSFNNVINVIHEEIQANRINGDPDGMNIFKRLLSCRDTNLYEKPDLENTIILHMLRYFYRINKDENLRLSIVEIKALFVTIFYHYATSTQRSFSTQINRHFFREMKICPSGRCVTIISWFLNVYHTTKSFCGTALNIRELIPLRKEVMNGSTLFAFYETVMGDARRIGHLSTEIRTKLQSIEMEILTMFDREYKFITEE